MNTAKLDLAVAEALGEKARIVVDEFVRIGDAGGRYSGCVIDPCPPGTLSAMFSPSTNWSDGGPIIAKHWDEITRALYRMFPREFPEGCDWWQQIKGKDFLKVAMQAFVKAKNQRDHG